jgi:hypothetical protein
MPARESKGERQLPVYQLDRSLREPQAVNILSLELREGDKMLRKAEERFED